MKQNLKDFNYKPVTFFVLSFLITWIAGGILIYQSQMGVEKDLILLFVAYMGPLFAALITMIVYKNFELLKDFGTRLFRFKVSDLKMLPVIIFLMPVAMVIAILISTAFGESITQLNLAEELQVFDGEVVLSMVILALVPILEELGWRGYGVDALRSRMSLLNTGLVFGLIWGLWHLPVFFIQGSYQAGLWALNPIFAINFFVGIIPLAIIMNWLYYKANRSILVASVFHIMVNYSSELFQATQVSKTILTGVLAVIAAVIVYMERDEKQYNGVAITKS